MWFLPPGAARFQLAAIRATYGTFITSHNVTLNMAHSHATDGGRAQLYCSPETREKVKALKRGGESYDDVLNKMVEQYDPDEA